MRWDDLFSHVVEYDPATAEKPVLPTGGGVYLLTDEQDRLIQLASAADLRRAVLGRLGIAQPAPAAPPAETPAAQAPEQTTPAAPPPVVQETQKNNTETRRRTDAETKSRRADLSAIVRRIRWQPTNSVFEAAYEYHRIARVVLPDTYLENIAFGPAWFIHVDAAAEVPRFAVGKVISAAAGTTLGPFATQQDANRFVQILEDAFDLCRYVNILEQAPHGQPCAYFEMGRCPAPCNASIPMSQYRETMTRALRFATGQRDEAKRGWEAQMREAAGRLEFERAAAMKQRLERAREIEHAAFKYVRPLEAFSWLIVQRGGGRTRVKPFFCAGGIQAGEVVKLKDSDAAAEQWVQTMCPPAGADSASEHATIAITTPGKPVEANDPRQLHSEQVWLVSHFLFRRERVGLFLDTEEVPEPARLAEMVREQFAPGKIDKEEQQQATTDSTVAEE